MLMVFGDTRDSMSHGMMGKFENRDEVPRILLDSIVPLVDVAKIIFEYVDYTINLK